MPRAFICKLSKLKRVTKKQMGSIWARIRSKNLQQFIQQQVDVYTCKKKGYMKRFACDVLCWCLPEDFIPSTSNKTCFLNLSAPYVSTTCSSYSKHACVFTPLQQVHACNNCKTQSKSHELSWPGIFQGFSARKTKLTIKITARNRATCSV